MLVFRILATVFVGISVITGLLKNIVIFCDKEDTEKINLGAVFGWCAWSILWRAFVIVAIWVI